MFTADIFKFFVSRRTCPSLQLTMRWTLTPLTLLNPLQKSTRFLLRPIPPHQPSRASTLFSTIRCRLVGPWILLQDPNRRNAVRFHLNSFVFQITTRLRPLLFHPRLRNASSSACQVVRFYRASPNLHSKASELRP